MLLGFRAQRQYATDDVRNGALAGSAERDWSHRRASLGREPEADLSTGPDGKRMESRVQLVRGVEGAYMIGAVQFSQPTPPSRPPVTSLPEDSVFSFLGMSRPRRCPNLLLAPSPLCNGRHLPAFLSIYQSQLRYLRRCAW